MVPFGADGYVRVGGLDKDDFDVHVTGPAGRVAGIALLDDDDRADSAISRTEILIKELGGDGEYQVRWVIGKGAGNVLEAGTYTITLESDAYQLRWTQDHDSVLSLEGDPDYTETIKIVGKDAAGDGVPMLQFLVTAAGGGKVDWGRVDVNGERTLYLPPANGYSVKFTRPGYTFAATAFNVVEGANADVEVTGTTSGVQVAGA